MTDFGVLSHPGSRNLGDDIQSLAAMRFLPRVDRFVPREALHRDPGGEGDTMLILNGWFMHEPRHWPPHEKLTPLLISMHITYRGNPRLRFWIPTVMERLLSLENIGYLRRHGPVGARDSHTENLLRRRGVECYHSGCLTLTLPLLKDAVRKDDVVACDLPAPLLVALARRLKRPPVVVTHWAPEVTQIHKRLARANAMLGLYARAKAVITTRLHCALPCLALGTPVLFIDASDDRGRVESALDLLHHCSATDYLLGRHFFDPDNPPANPELHRKIAAQLTRRAEDFVLLHSASPLHS